MPVEEKRTGDYFTKDISIIQQTAKTYKCRRCRPAGSPWRERSEKI